MLIIILSYIEYSQTASVLIIFLKLFWRCLNINRESQGNRVNQYIQVKEALVIDEKNEKLGVISVNNALEKANLKNLDLVQVAPEVKTKDGKIKPAVCKMMDYGKYCYEQDKKDKESKKNQKVITIKEIRLSVNIGENDFQIRVNRAISFLEKGKKVKVSIRFKGRENSNPSRGYENMHRFADACFDFASVETAAKLENKTMTMLLVPKQVFGVSVNKDESLSENNGPQSRDNRGPINDEVESVNN